MTAPAPLWGQTGRVRDFVAKMLRMKGADFDPCEAMGVVRDGALVGGVVYSDYREYPNGATMEASWAAVDPDWLNRSVLREAFRYPFETNKVTRLQVCVARSNGRARAINLRLGFRYEGMARMAWRGCEDSACYSMLPQECKWIE